MWTNSKHITIDLTWIGNNNFLYVVIGQTSQTDVCRKFTLGHNCRIICNMFEKIWFNLKCQRLKDLGIELPTSIFTSE